MRRLPVFFVLDVSESMVGENLRKLEEGISSIVRTLRQDPHALETVYVSVIAFAGRAKTIVPLMEVSAFYPPKLPVGGGTSLGGALFHLMAELDNTLVKNTQKQKGDWKPVIYLITDGKPTDNVSAALSKWKNEYAEKATLVAIALGRFADLSVLGQLTRHTLVLENTSDADFKKFIDWVTNSVKTQSRIIDDTPSKGVNLTKIDETVLSIIKDAKDLRPIDPDYVILTGRCQHTSRPYLMKFERNTQQLKHQDFSINATNYMVSGCYPVEEDYFEWSSDASTQLKVNTAELMGTPRCPHCESLSAFALCACGKIMCVNGPGLSTCPWCKVTLNFAMDDGENFDVNRARG
jgi:uncharacterized protein YegL